MTGRQEQQAPLGFLGSLTENLKLKLIALFLSLLFFSLFHGVQEPRSIPVAIVARFPSPETKRVLVSHIPPQARITLRGPKALLDDVHPDDLSIVLDLSDGQATRIKLETTQLSLPPSVHVEAVDPPVLDGLKWEDELSRDVPVLASLFGALPAGLVLRRAPMVEPRSIRVSGPKSEVAVVQHVRAEPLDLSGLSSGVFRKQVRIEHGNGKVVIDPSVTTVLVTAEVIPELGERSFVRIPVSVLGHPRLKTQPAEVDVRVKCPPSIERALRAEQVLPHVAIKSAAHSGLEAFPVEVTAIDQCEVNVTPPQVLVRW